MLVSDVVSVFSMEIAVDGTLEYLCADTKAELELPRRCLLERFWETQGTLEYFSFVF